MNLFSLLNLSLLPGLFLLGSCLSEPSQKKQLAEIQVPTVSESAPVPFPTPGQPRALTQFLSDLYEHHEGFYQKTKQEEYQFFCQQNQLEPSDSLNLRTFHHLRFFHQLFTTNSVENCSRTGMLEIPYFWHWVEENPRHQILYLPDSILLSSKAPFKGFSRYASAADIDRTPALYLGDLVSDHAKYAHPDCGSFFTFGWCSEREMAFVLLMEIYGYQGKVVTNSNHSWAEFLVELHNTRGQQQHFIARIDNTFDGFAWERFSGSQSSEEWLAAQGNEKLHKWYNQKAHASTEKKVVASLQVSPAAMERIGTQVHAYLRD